VAFNLLLLSNGQDFVDFYSNGGRDKAVREKAQSDFYNLLPSLFLAVVSLGTALPLAVYAMMQLDVFVAKPMEVRLCASDPVIGESGAVSRLLAFAIETGVLGCRGKFRGLGPQREEAHDDAMTVDMDIPIPVTSSMFRPVRTTMGLYILRYVPTDMTLMAARVVARGDDLREAPNDSIRGQPNGLCILDINTTTVCAAGMEVERTSWLESIRHGLSLRHYGYGAAINRTDKCGCPCSSRGSGQPGLHGHAGGEDHARESGGIGSPPVETTTLMGARPDPASVGLAS